MKWVTKLYNKFFGYQREHSIYRVGQVWEYKTREHEANSRLCIVHIDKSDHFGYIFHVYINDLLINNPNLEGGIQYELPHSSFDESSLTRSLVQQVGIASELPNIDVFYAQWKESYLSGETGPAVDVSIDASIQYIEDSLKANA